MKMNQIVLPSLVIIFLHFFNTTLMAEQDLLTLGDHLIKEENYDSAITEYKRFIFFHPDDRRVAETYYNIGLAYRAQGLWQEAIVAMRNAMFHTTNEDKKSNYQINLAVTLIASKNYDLAQLELIKVMLRDPNIELDKRVYFLRVVSYIYQFQWEDAHEVIKEYTADEKLNELIDKAIHLPLKSTNTAKVLSTIIPGAGQFYTGDWRGGLNAFVLNSLLGYVAVDAMLEQHYADAVFWMFFIFNRYYQGNSYRAEIAVKTHNKEVSEHTANEILDRLQEIAETP